MSKFLELIEVFEIDLELEGCSALGPGERYENAGFETAFARSFKLLPNRIESALAVCRQDIIRKTSKVHWGSSCVGDKL